MMGIGLGAEYPLLVKKAGKMSVLPASHQSIRYPLKQRRAVATIPPV
jgi:hypothetical protein